MASNIKLKNNLGNTFTLEHTNDTGDVSLTSKDILANTLTVDTMSDLVALDPSKYDKVWLLGYYTKGDKEPVLYHYDATLAEENGGTKVLSSVGSGGWYFEPSGSVNVKDFGAKGDGVTDDTVAIQSVLDLANEVFIPSSTSYYNTDRLTINSNQKIYSDGAEISLTNTSSCLEFDNVARIVIKDLKFNTQIANTLLGNFKNDSYDITFDNCTFQGNSGTNTQVGLGFTNSYIITFNSCYVLNFGVNVRFGVQANRIVFNGSSIRSNQTNNHTLVRVEGGVNNSFIGCDIENCVSWIDYGSITSIEDDASVNFTNCYLEASLNPIELKYGAFLFENCFISECRYKLYSTAKATFLNNIIVKTGSSFFLYFMTTGIDNFVMVDNFVRYDTGNEATTGLVYRGFASGYQYVSNGDISSPTWTNGYFTSVKNVNIQQNRIYDVNTGNRVRYNQSTANDLYLGSNMTLSGNLYFSNNASNIILKDGQWNQGHIKFANSNVHMWIVPSGSGTSQLRIKYGTPGWNTDGVLVATF